MNTLTRNITGTAIVAILAISGALLNSRSAVADTSKDVVVTPLPLPVSITGRQ